MSQKYKYKALTHSGEKVSDHIFAINEVAAREALKAQSMIVLSLTLERNINFLGGQGKVTSSDIEQSTNQLATLLENGLKINDALKVLTETSSSQTMAQVWHEIFLDVQAGTSLYQALEKYPYLFDVLYLEMTNIAENTGTLPSVFRSLADNLAFQRDLKNKTIQALTYPLIILFVCVSAIFAIFNFVIPNMESVFASAQNLPSYTQWLLDTSHFVSENTFSLLAFLVGTIGILFIYANQPENKQRFYSVMAKLPLLGIMIAKAEQIRFASAMSLTLQSGLSLSDSLSLSIKTLTSDKNRVQLEKAKQQVDTGSSLAQSLASSYFLDRISLSLIKVGEESGTLEKSFSEVTKRAKTDFESWMLKMTALLEPLLILIMGGIVGGVVVVMLLSIVSVNDLSI